MRTVFWTLGLVLTIAGITIIFPALITWGHLILSGGSAFDSYGRFSSDIEPTFKQFAIGALLLATGQIFGKIGNRQRMDN